MRIGYFLLSADPFHVAHIALPVYCLNNGLVDKAYIVPALQNPWKNRYVATFEERCDMIRKCVKNIKNCELEDIEKENLYPYSCYTLDNLYNKYGKGQNIHYVIMGCDTFNSIQEWRFFDEMIKDRFEFIVFARDGEVPSVKNLNYTLVAEDMFSGISSTLVRKLIAEGKTAFPYLPECILKDCYRIYSDPYRIKDFTVENL